MNIVVALPIQFIIWSVYFCSSGKFLFILSWQAANHNDRRRIFRLLCKNKISKPHKKWNTFLIVYSWYISKFFDFWRHCDVLQWMLTITQSTTTSDTNPLSDALTGYICPTWRASFSCNFEKFWFIFTLLIRTDCVAWKHEDRKFNFAQVSYEIVEGYCDEWKTKFHKCFTLKTQLQIFEQHE